MASHKRFTCFSADLACGVHNLRDHVLKIALCAVEPDPAADEVLDDISEVEPGHGYEAGGGITLQKLVSENGVLSLILSPVVFKNASTSDDETADLIGPWQWAVLYNASAAHNHRGRKGHPLIAAWAYRREIDLGPQETYVWRIKGNKPVLTLG